MKSGRILIWMNFPHRQYQVFCNGFIMDPFFPAPIVWSGLKRLPFRKSSAGLSRGTWSHGDPRHADGILHSLKLQQLLMILMLLKKDKRVLPVFIEKKMENICRISKKETVSGPIQNYPVLKFLMFLLILML
ncbi:MAG TPA: hypothetical protein P5013_08815 [Methanoregula sp.]|nr:hypothetical protein [Methanoregula sp.]